jgi:hypothetical protein
MLKGRILLPWVISGLSMACLAIAVMVSANRAAPGISRAPSQASVAVVPPTQLAVPAAAPAPTVAAAPAPTPPAAPVFETASPPPAAATAPGAQIWECRTNGQRTFSDKPCGDKPVLREVSALNIMNPTPILPPTRSYEPEPSYAPEYSYPEAQEPAEAAYPVMVGYPVYVGYPYNHRRRPDHAHRPYPHPHAATPRKIQ